MKYYVYLWIDPKTGIERYVGKGGYPQRVLDHWYANTRLGYMLRKRKREGFNPQPVFIKQGLDELTASAVEKFWIKVYGREDLGTGALFNLTDGGDGCSGRIPYIRTDEIKEKVGAKNRGKVPHNKGKVSPEKGIPNPKKSHPNKNKGKKLGPNPKNSHPNKNKGIPKPEQDVKCPHCDIEGRNQIMHRWHFDNCKKKKESEDSNLL